MKETMMYQFVADACVAAVKGDPYSLAEVCELSDRLLHLMHPDMNHVHVEGMTSSYPKASQDLYNNILSEVECALEKVGLVYSEHYCDWVIPDLKNDTFVQIPFPLGDRDIFVHSPKFATAPFAYERVKDLLKEFKETAKKDYSIDDVERFLSSKGCTILSVTRVEGEY